MVRITAAALGLAVGLVALGHSAPASAAHILLRATGADADAFVITDPPAAPVAEIREPVILFGDLRRAVGTSFVHRFDFGVEAPGPGEFPGAVSLNPNRLFQLGVVAAGFSDFEATLFGPDLGADGVDLARIGPTLDPRENVIEAAFAAIDTSEELLYRLVVTGTLSPTAEAGNYSGNISVIPLPGAVVLFLTALGGLAIIRFRRSSGEPTAA
jgi:hypothetical protein